MDAFGHLSVLFSIILGLAITQVLQGFRGLLQARHRLRAYAPAIGWAILLLILSAQSWWAMFGLRNVVEWHFASFGIVLMQLTLTYLLAALVLPDVVADDERMIDLRTHYFAQHRWFFSLWVVVLLTSVLKERIIDGQWLHGANLWFHCFFIVSCATLALSSRDAVHRLMLPVAAISIAAYITLLFTVLR